MKKFIQLIAVVALLGACSKPAEQNSNSDFNPNLVDGQLIVRIADGANEKDEARILGQFQKSEAINKSDRTYLVSDPMLKNNEKLAADRLSKDSAIDYAQPNYRVYTNQNLPQDPFFMKLWGLKNFGQDAPNGIEGKEGADIGAIEAWATSKGSKTVRVAVVDTGCTYAHPDLAANIWVNQAEKDGVQGVDDDKNGYVDDIHGWDAVSDNRNRVYFNQVGDPDPLDDQGHGTHVSGTIGAVGANGIGLVGVNQVVSIACVKFLDSRGSGTTHDEMRALEYVLANEFDVVNGSYGGGDESPAIKRILEKGRQKGILFVFAAGNDTNNNDTKPSWPASYKLDNVISVAATDSRDQIADFSNFGQTSVHIAAPGVNILSTVPPVKGDMNNAYAVYSGTSMASPHVAGAAALLIAADPKLVKKPAAVKERLMATAEFKPQLAAMVASGRLNIARAIKNDTSGNPINAGQWQEVPYAIETPRYPQKKVDNSWEIKVPGAKAMQVHILEYQVESGFDTAVLYDSAYRPVMTLVGESANVWSPIVLGDTAYIKFSNSLVSIKGGEAFANFNSQGVVVDKVKVLK